MSNDTQPEIRFPGFTDDWEQRKFGVTNSYFTDGNYGESYPSADELSDKLNGVPFLRGSNLKNGRLVEEDANYITPEKHAELTSGHLELDDIVVAVRGSLGALGYAGQENVGWNINSQLAIIRTDKSELKGQFLIQYLLSSKGQKELLSRNTGTALKQLPIKQLKDVPVPIPGIDEQDRIGSFFVNLDTTIALHQRKLDLLKETKKGFLQKMFPKNGAKVPEIRFPGFTGDWEQCKLGDIAKMYQPPTISGSELLDTGYPVFGANGYIGFYSKSNHLEDQVTISARGEGTGTPSYVKAPVWITGNSMVINVEDFDINKKFLYAMLLSYSLKKYITGGAQPQLTRDVLLKVPIIIPSYNEQFKIGTFFKQLDDTIALQQRKLDLLKETKKGFLQKMFV
ncbi:restriction endonuclease subunit S [Enterococcus faecalis]|nr:MULTISPECIES: restriction endonuclease subunit S [Enterococcus]EGO2673903.1 restriction endonuclease subunit S [Enterococcus faecalis]EGO2692782.1 restriction endonuclease subunit S [Enterococcus faecalis]EGO7796697.1 restriction endonuclease subunit S [Enterococcus faecalis]EGO9264983.1 restriction endonuclease subunit S [Enterococcus faecalis]EGP4901963.1 restriction endonuclease subunit S [Enterococcus faecium]